MGLKLNLFIHGVPKGQKIWGPQESDRNYLESFYGRKPNIEVQLLVDVLRIGADLNCYYTYLRGEDILDKDSRAGSYFALTVRVNAYYADLFNMYNILDAAYQKVILGTILREGESATRYIVDDFNHVDARLQEVDKHIVNYLSTFSLDSDFVGLTDFASNAKSDAVNVNLLECNNKKLLTHVRAKGNISISPLYPTSQLVENVRKKDEEIKGIKLQMQQQIADEKKRSEQEIQTIRKEYASVDKTIADLEKHLETGKQSIATLTNSIKESEAKLSDYSIVKQKLSAKEQQLNEANKMLSGVKQLMNGFNGSNASNDLQHFRAQPNYKRKKRLETFNQYLPLANLILTILTLAAILFFIFQISSNQVKDIGNNGKDKVGSQASRSNR